MDEIRTLTFQPSYVCLACGVLRGEIMFQFGKYHWLVWNTLGDTLDPPLGSGDCDTQEAARAAIEEVFRE